MLEYSLDNLSGYSSPSDFPLIRLYQKVMLLGKLKNWLDFSKWIELDRLALASAIRTVAAALVPLIVLRLLGQPGFGLLMTLAGLNVSRTDPRGPYRTKAQVMATATIGVALTAFLATGLSTTGWWTALFMFGLAFGCAFAGGFGNTASIVTFAFIQIFVITVGLPGDGWAAAPVRLVACLAGGAWAMFLVLWVWPLRPEKPVKDAVAGYYQAISNFIGQICRATANNGSREELTKKQKASEDARTTAVDFLVKARASRQGASRLSQNLVALTTGAGELADTAVQLSQELETGTWQKYAGQVRPEIERILQELAEAAGHIAENIRNEAGETGLGKLDKAVSNFDETITRLRHTSPNLESDYPAMVELRNISNALSSMAAALGTAAEIAEDLGERSARTFSNYSLSRFKRRDLGELFNRIRDSFTINALIFRHALRMGVFMALGVLLYLALNPDHGYWITLTILVILKPDFGGTIERTYYRVLGTVVGGILGALLAATIHFDPLLYLLMAILGVLAFSQLPNNYGLFVILLTPFVILLIDLSQPGNWEIAGIRILNTLIGGIMALVATYLFLPGWQRRFLPEQLARTIEANRAYFRAVIDAYLGRAPDPAKLLKTREQAHIETVNAETAFQRLLAEPKRQQANVTPFYGLVTYNRHFLDSVTTMAAHLSDFSGQHQLAGLPEYAGWIDNNLKILEEAVRRGDNPGQPPALDENRQAIQAAMRKLSARRIAELKENRGHPATTARQAIFDFTTVARVLERLSQDVTMMYREQNQVSRG